MNARSGRVRYAVVGLGWIAQEDVLPAFGVSGENSELAALVSSDQEKRAQLGEKYGVQAVDYDHYDELLASGDVDAVYIALPNSLHLEYTQRAAQAGVHVLCEKPMEISVERCQKMIEACDDAGVKLMIAYRLHFESGNMAAVDLVRSGKIGEPRIFMGQLTQQTRAPNVRLKEKMGGGPLLDEGPYPINAARYIFRAEPTEVIAMTATNGEERFKEVPEMSGVVMRFPGDRLALFTVSFGASGTSRWQVVGTEGDFVMDPGFGFEEEVQMHLTIGGKKQTQTFAKTQQFAGEIVYFSRCILEDKHPEADGAEGRADVRIVEAIKESARTGRAVKISGYAPQQRPDSRQVEREPFVQDKQWVDASSPQSKGD